MLSKSRSLKDLQEWADLRYRLGAEFTLQDRDDIYRFAKLLAAADDKPEVRLWRDLARSSSVRIPDLEAAAS